MTPEGLYLESGSEDYSKPDDVTWETGISGTKGLSIFGFLLVQQRYINLLPQEKKKEVPKIVYYFYKNNLLFLQKRKHQT